MNSLIKKTLLASGLSLMLGACASTPQDTAIADDSQLAADEQYQSMQSQAHEQAELGQARSLSDQELALLEQTRLHFDFDQAGIKPEYQAVLEAHAKHLMDNPAKKLRLEGHADERGTREYNMALGERRAVNVAQSLVMMGVSQQQIDTSSLGEEAPLVVGRGEESYYQNRRVELQYQEATQVSENQSQNW